MEAAGWPRIKDVAPLPPECVWRQQAGRESKMLRHFLLSVCGGSRLAVAEAGRSHHHKHNKGLLVSPLKQFYARALKRNAGLSNFKDAVTRMLPSNSRYQM